LDRSLGRHGGATTGLERRLCLIGGLNQNYTSRSGTPYHIQIEDLGPLIDRLSEQPVRRVNVIVYANYGEPNARIIYGRDHDYPDIRSQDHNRFIGQQIQELAAAARTIIEEREQRNIERIKGQIRQYHATKSEASKKEFEESNALYPFLFSRAWQELKREHAPGGAAPAETETPFSDVIYPLDTELREHVLEIERITIGIGQDLARLRAQGRADEVLAQTCGKLVGQARAVLSGRDKSEFNSRRLGLTRNSLLTTWRQIRAQLKD